MASSVVYLDLFPSPKSKSKCKSQFDNGAAFHSSSSHCSSCRSLGGTSTKATSGCSWGLVARACFDSALAKARRDTTSLFGGRDCTTAIRRFQLSSLR